MRTKRKRLTATEALRQAISESGMNFLQLEKKTGVLRQSIMKFVRGEQSLRLDAADKLMECLEITVQLPPLARHLIRLREGQGLTQQEIADLAGFSLERVQQLEAGASADDPTDMKAGQRIVDAIGKKVILPKLPNETERLRAKLGRKGR